MLYPLKLRAPLKSYLWGGTKLKARYGKETALETVAESWELACRPEGCSVIENGAFSGRTLESYVQAVGRAVLGKRAASCEDFPLLVKLIDACGDLSVQVHPDDARADQAAGEAGKTELWYIVDAEPGASLLYGFAREISPAEFKRRIADNTLLEVCNRVRVRRGDVFFIPAGTLHAIGKGTLVAEVQQNSNTTYRIYDYGRKDADGKARALHVDKALRVTRLSPSERLPTFPALRFLDGYELRHLAACAHFSASHIAVRTRCALRAAKDTFHSILVLEGAPQLRWQGESLRLRRGDSVFIPAGLSAYALEGAGEVLLSML